MQRDNLFFVYANYMYPTQISWGQGPTSSPPQHKVHGISVAIGSSSHWFITMWITWITRYTE